MLGKRKTKYACIVDADETKRPRLDGAVHKHHQDHITEIEMNSLNHYNLVNKFIPMPEAMKYQMQRQQWRKNVKIGENTGMASDKVTNTNEVMAEARNQGAKVHFASLMDICHLKNAELEKKHQKNKGRVVFEVTL